MASLSAKLRSVRTQGGTGIAFWCPGCDSAHVVTTEGDRSKGPVWSWDGNVDVPTISPSILVTYSGRDAGMGDAPPARCHSFVRSGAIEFLSDCTHAHAGQTVAIPDFPEDYAT